MLKSLDLGQKMTRSVVLEGQGVMDKLQTVMFIAGSILVFMLGCS